MTRRQILYMILSFSLTIFVVLVLIVVVLMLDKPNVEIVWEQQATAAASVQKRKIGKWERKEKKAIALAKNVQVFAPEKPEVKRGEEESKVPISEVINSKYVEKNFKMSGLKFVGWEAKYLKKAYYFVSYTYRDELVDVGPVWLVDVKNGRVMPKNAIAKALMDRSLADPKAYFEKEKKVVRFIANHTFEKSKVNLGGIMLIHFSRLKSRKEGDKILGWTVVHDYGAQYRAFFQWIEDGEPTYAEFEFDERKKALRGKNLQAANLMQEGDEYEAKTKVGILPTTYNPDAARPKDRWTGNSRKLSQKKKYKDQFAALATILQDRELIQAMESLLTETSETSEKFEQCKEDRRCSWKPTSKGDGLYTVEYKYDLAGEGTTEEADRVIWDVHVKERRIIPQTRLSNMAYRAVHPRTALVPSNSGS